LYEAGVLTWLDREALACLCICWSTIKQADAEIQARGLALESSRGPVTNPAVRIRRAALDQFKALAVEFGMTPSARSRVNANPPRPETDEDRSDALVARLIAPPPRRSMQEYLDEQDCK
jgi:P27 family predicted phage terminase small subunit